MKTLRYIAVAAIAMIALSGCTDSDATTGGSTSTSKADLTPATVGVIPIADTAPIYLGKSKGFFEDEGIDLTIETATGGAAIVPAVTSGDYQFGFSNMLSLMVAAEKGLDIKVVSAAVATTGDTSKDFGAVIVKGDSPVATMADLAGKTVSSNSLGNINDTVVRTLIDQDGGDSSTTNFVEVAFPDAQAAVENGQIDAAFVVEPFVTAALEAGDKVVSYAYADFDPKLDIASYFTTGDFISSNPDLVKKFQAAMKKSLQYAQDNPDEVRDIIATYTKTPAETLAKIGLPTYPTEINKDAQVKLGDAAKKYGVLSTAPDLDALLP
jgi:NitT/TauT family transport system substrate-binding protein